SCSDRLDHHADLMRRGHRSAHRPDAIPPVIDEAQRVVLWTERALHEARNTIAHALFDVVDALNESWISHAGDRNGAESTQAHAFKFDRRFAGGYETAPRHLHATWIKRNDVARLEIHHALGLEEVMRIRLLVHHVRSDRGRCQPHIQVHGFELEVITPERAENAVVGSERNCTLRS